MELDARLGPSTSGPSGSTVHVVQGAERLGSEVNLSVEIRPGDDETVIVLAGDLEVSTAPRLREILDGVPIDTPTIVLDMADLGFVDSTGIGCLFKLERRAADNGGIVVARHPPAQVHRVMEMTQLNRLIAIVTD